MTSFPTYHWHPRDGLVDFINSRHFTIDHWYSSYSLAVSLKQPPRLKARKIRHHRWLFKCDLTVIRIQILGLFTVTWIGLCYVMCINAIHSYNQCFIMESTNSGSGESRFKPIRKVIGVLILRWVFNKMQVLFISDIHFHGLVLNLSQGPSQIQLSSKW